MNGLSLDAQPTATRVVGIEIFHPFSLEVYSMIRRGRSSLALAVFSAAVLAAPVLAQDVEYTTVGKVELGGVLGTFARLGGAGDETTTKVYIKGGMMRTDADKSSTIVDLENGRFISLDHNARTYTIMTFAQMAQMAEEAAAKAKGEGQKAEGKPETAEKPEGEVDLDYKLDIQATGEKQKINGYDSERYFMTMETEATVTPEGGEAEKAGKLVVFTDVWNAQNAPVEQALKDFHAKSPEAARRNADSMKGMMAVFASKPEVSKAMEEAGKEMAEMSGFGIRETMYMVIVPPELTFDREATLAVKPKASGGDKAKKALGGLLSGKLGGKKDEPSEEEGKPAQFTLAKVTSEVKDMKLTALSADLFGPPADYKEKPFNPPTE
jgi:hypothetical protein